MPDSTLSRRSAALMGAWTRPPLLPKTHKFHTETAEEPNRILELFVREIVFAQQVNGVTGGKTFYRSSSEKMMGY